MLSDEKRLELIRAHGTGGWQTVADMDRFARAVAEAAVKEPLRYTSDGALAECPCCGSLDVGGAHDTVHCYKCGLSMKHPPPLQNAAEAWNRRTRPQASAAVPTVSLRAIEWLMNTVNGVTYLLPIGMQAEFRAMLAASQPEVKS